MKENGEVAPPDETEWRVCSGRADLFVRPATNLSISGQELKAV